MDADSPSLPRPWERVPFFRRAPLVPAAGVFVLGVAAGLALPRPGPWWALLAGAAALAWLRGGALRLGGLALALFAIGAMRAAWEVRAAGRLERAMDRPREQVEVEFQVTGEAAPATLRRRDSEEWGVPARLLRIRREQGFIEERASLWIRVPGPLPPDLFAYGNRIAAAGVLERREGQGAMLWPSDYRLTLASVADAERLPGRGGSRFVAACQRLRDRGAVLLADRSPEAGPAGAVLRGLTLGLRGGIDDEINDLFARTGTLHILAVSGLHVVIIGGLFAFALRWSPLPRHRWGLVLIPALAVFVCATGLKASAVRAWIMASCFGVAPLLWRKPDSRTALALAAAVILALSPRQLLDLGFQFSFLAMLALIGFGPVVDAALRRRLAPDPFLEPLPGAADPPGRRWARAGLGLLAMNLVAWGATAPLTASVFHVFSPVAVVSNLLVVPLSTLACWLGFLALVGGSVWPAAGAWAQQAGLWTIDAMLAWARLTEGLPGAWQYVRTPSLIFSILFHAGLAWLLLRQRLGRAFAVWSLLSLAALGWDARRREALRELRVFNHDGVSTVVGVAGESRALVADPGGRFGAYQLTRSLKELGLDRLEIWCSRLDTRRAGALEELIPHFRVERVVIPWGDPVSPLADSLAAAGIPLEAREAGGDSFLGDLFAQALAPLPGQSSLAARFSREGLGLLWMGALPPGEEARWTREGRAPAAPVVVANPSAGGGSLGDELLAAVQPRLILISRAAFPDVRRAQQPAVDRWLRAGWRVAELETGQSLRFDLTSPGLNEFLRFSTVNQD